MNNDQSVAAIVGAAMARLIALLQCQANANPHHAAAYEAAARQAEQDRRTWIALLSQAPAIETWIRYGAGAAGYPLDFFDLLDEGETIAGATVTATSGATVQSVLIAPSLVTAYIIGGRAGETIQIDAHATTDRGRSLHKSIGLIASEEPIQFTAAPAAAKHNNADILRIAAIGADLDDALAELVTCLHDAAQRQPQRATAHEAAATEIERRRQQWQQVIIEILEAAA